jgi:hypothetical protein
VDQIVGRHGFDLYAVDGLDLPVFHRPAAGNLACGGSVGYHDGLGLDDLLQGRGVQVVAVLVGDEHEVGLGQLPVVGEFAVRIDVDDLVPERQIEGPVADEGDLQVAGRGGNDIGFKGARGACGGGAQGDGHHPWHESVHGFLLFS